MTTPQKPSPSAASSSDSATPRPGAARDTTRTRSSGAIVTAIVLGVVALLLVGAAAIEFGARSRIKQCLSTAIEETVGVSARVSLGLEPVIFSPITGKLPDISAQADGGPDTENEQAPSTDSRFGNSTPRLQLDITGLNIDREPPIAESVQGEVEVSGEAMATAAQSPAGQQGILAGLTRVESIIPDPQQGLLNVTLGGGLVRAQVTPEVVNGQLVMRPDGVSLLGFSLPAELLDRATAFASDTVAELPRGVNVTSAKVTEIGLALAFTGKEVELTSNGDLNGESDQWQCV